MRPRLFVSLTTIPSRMAGIERCLASLADQTWTPERILLNVPQAYRRFEMPQRLAFDVGRFGGLVELVRCPRDDGPGTKLLGGLDHIPREPDVCLVLVDDDVEYRPDMLETIAGAFAADPQSAWSFHVYRYRGLDVGQGADGFAIPAVSLRGAPAFFRALGANPYVFFVDDLWISYYLWMNSVPIRSLAGRVEGLVYSVYNDEDALARQSGNFTRRRAMSRTRNYLRRRMGLRGLLMRLRKRLGG